MSGLPWYPHDIEAYNRKTRALTMQQDGAYRRLLDHYYDTELPLPAPLADIFRIARCAGVPEQKAVTHVLNAFFTLEADGWHNIRADDELDRRSEVSQKRSKAGTASAAKRQHKPNTCSTRVDTSNTRQEDKPSLRSGLRARAKKPKTPLPEGFPEQFDLEKACVYWRAHDADALCLEIDDVVLSFQAYQRKNDVRSADWPSSWTTWYVNAIKFKKENGNGHGRKSAHAKAVEGFGLWLQEERNRSDSDEIVAALPAPRPHS